MSTLSHNMAAFIYQRRKEEMKRVCAAQTNGENLSLVKKHTPWRHAVAFWE
jgi:hypothetical protein